MDSIVHLDLKSYGGKDNIQRVLTMQFAAMTEGNKIWLSVHPRAPLLYKSGVRYKNDRIYPHSSEDWSDIPNIIKKGWDDCESLSCWLAAEMATRAIHSVGRGRRPGAKCILRRTKTLNLWHAVVWDPHTKKIFDPSRVLGMGSNKRG